MLYSCVTIFKGCIVLGPRGLDTDCKCVHGASGRSACYAMTISCCKGGVMPGVKLGSIEQPLAASSLVMLTMRQCSSASSCRCVRGGPVPHCGRLEVFMHICWLPMLLLLLLASICFAACWLMYVCFFSVHRGVSSFGITRQQGNRRGPHAVGSGLLVHMHVRSSALF